jgi:threonine dehydrogenase-like Zn-dependent dehydrogenase
LVERPEPTITSNDEVKIKVIQVGICGTDREEAAGGRANAPAGKHELIIGHEMFGKVVETGSEVTKVKPGDFALFTVRRGCNHCIACLNNRSDMCYSGEYTERGIKGYDGFQAQYVVDKEQYLVKVPSEISTIGVLTEPLSVAEKAIDIAVKVQELRLPGVSDNNWLQGKRTLITGLGPIGLMAAFVLRLRRAEVIGMDIVDDGSPRVELLKEIGGNYIDGRKISGMELDNYLGQIDLIFEGTGVAELEFQLIDALGINGIYVLSGIPGGSSETCISGAELLRQMVLKNQIMIGSVNAGIEHYTMAVEDLKRARQVWGDTIDKVITQVVPYTKFEEVLHEHSPDEIKVVVDWEGDSL